MRKEYELVSKELAELKARQQRMEGAWKCELCKFLNFGFRHKCRDCGTGKGVQPLTKAKEKSRKQPWEEVQAQPPPQPWIRVKGSGPSEGGGFRLGLRSWQRSQI